MSEAALTDSTTPTTSPAFTFAPTFGNSTNTMSPRASCAKSVMPTASVPSGSVRTHSWVGVYLSFSGVFTIACLVGSVQESVDQALAVAHEGRRHDAGAQALAADLDLDS